MVGFDTDSVMFRSLCRQPDPSLGDYLGDFNDQLPDGDPIVELETGDLKNNRYLTSWGKEKCKVRGISLNSDSVGIKHSTRCSGKSGVRQTNAVKP